MRYNINLSKNILCRYMGDINNCLVRIEQSRMYNNYRILLLFLVFPDIFLAAFDITEPIKLYNTVVFSLVSFQFALKLITLRLRIFNDSWNILDVIYIALCWCMYDYPYISVFRLIYNFRIVRLFRIIRTFSTLRRGLYRFTFVLKQF